MEIGLINEENGITYFDLVGVLEKELNFKFGEQSELTFWYGSHKISERVTKI